LYDRPINTKQDISEAAQEHTVSPPTLCPVDAMTFQELRLWNCTALTAKTFTHRPAQDTIIWTVGDFFIDLFDPATIEMRLDKNAGWGSEHWHVDWNTIGAYFGTTFAHMLFHVYPELVPKIPNKIYAPAIYGFKISEYSRCGPRMQWLRTKVDANLIDVSGKLIKDSGDSEGIPFFGWSARSMHFVCVLLDRVANMNYYMLFE